MLNERHELVETWFIEPKTASVRTSVLQQSHRAIRNGQKPDITAWGTAHLLNERHEVVGNSLGVLAQSPARVGANLQNKVTGDVEMMSKWSSASRKPIKEMRLKLCTCENLGTGDRQENPEISKAGFGCPRWASGAGDF